MDSNKFNHDHHIKYAIAPLDRPPVVSGGTPAPKGEVDPKTPNIILRRVVVGTIATVAAGAIAATAYFATEPKDSVGEKPPEATSTSLPVDTNEGNGGEVVTNNSEYSVEQLELSADLSSEELGKLIVETRITQWMNAGFNAELTEKWLSPDNKLSDGEFVTAEAQKQGAIFEEALLVPGWETTSLVDFAQGREQNNASTLENALKTSDSYYDDEPYQRGMIADSVTEISNDGTTRVISIDFTETGNSDKNRVGEDFAPDAPAIEGLQGTYTFTLVKSADGKTEKIQSFTNVSR